MANHPRFEINPAKNGECRFVLTAANGQVILTGESYASKAGCKNGIASVQKNAGDDSKYQRKVSSNDKHYFNLLAGNNQVIGTSQMYAAKDGMEKGIASVKTNASIAEIHDTTTS